MVRYYYYILQRIHSILIPPYISYGRISLLHSAAYIHSIPIPAHTSYGKILLYSKCIKFSYCPSANTSYGRSLLLHTSAYTIIKYFILLSAHTSYGRILVHSSVYKFHSHYTTYGRLTGILYSLTFYINLLSKRKF
jgi:hypothetical protein